MIEFLINVNIIIVVNFYLYNLVNFKINQINTFVRNDLEYYKSFIIVFFSR